MHNGSLSFIPLAKRISPSSSWGWMCQTLSCLCTNSSCNTTSVPCFRIWSHFLPLHHSTIAAFRVAIHHTCTPCSTCLSLTDNSDFPSFLNCFKPFWSTLINQINKKFFPYEAWNNLWTTHPIWNIAAGRSLDSLTTRPLLQRPGGDERCVHWTLPSVHFNGLLWSIILGAELWQEF